MTQPLVDLVEQFCQYQLKQRGKTEGGVQSYRWVLEQFLMFVKSQQGRVVRVTDLTQSSIQLWMDEMASDDLAMSTMRSRQSALSSFCAWLVKRGVLQANPVAGMDRPPHRIEPPRQVPGRRGVGRQTAAEDGFTVGKEEAGYPGRTSIARATMGLAGLV